MLTKVRPCLRQTCPSKRFRKLFFTLPSCEISHLASRPQPIADGFGRCSRTLEAAFQRHSLALATLHTLLYSLAPQKNGTHFKWWIISLRCNNALMAPAGPSCLAGHEQRTNLQSYQKKTCAKLERCFALWESAGIYGMVTPYRFWSCRAASCSSVPVTVSRKHEFFRDKGESSSGQVKGTSFRLHIIPASVNVYRRPNLTWDVASTWAFYSFILQGFFLKVCNALLPWPQLSLRRKGCKEWIAFSLYLDKEKSIYAD